MASLRTISVAPRALDDYQSFDPRHCALARQYAEPLKGKTVIHINATASGGGVAEMLPALVGLERDMGLDSHWFVLEAPADFFSVTKHIHNILQGSGSGLTDQEQQCYTKTLHDMSSPFRRAVEQLPPGILVFHDPQPLGLACSVPEMWRSIFRLHVDIVSAHNDALKLLESPLLRCDATIVSTPTHQRVLSEESEGIDIAVIAPAIDPLSPKNVALTPSRTHEILQQLGIDAKRPFLLQVSRFDRFKDPVGVIEAWKIARQTVPGLQLVLAGLILAQDDPEAGGVLAEARKAVAGNADAFLFWDPTQIASLSNDEFIGALYAGAHIVLQKSIREGFGLTITEAMWGSKPVIAGRTPGTELQIAHGTNGLLVDSIEEAAQAVVRLSQDEHLRQTIGEAAHESVRDRYLLPRHLAEHLELYQRLL